MADKWLLTAEDSVLFGQLVLEKGFAQETAVKECLQEQDQLRKKGRMAPLSQLLVRRRALAPRNLPGLLRELKERLHSCPGCRAMFLLEGDDEPDSFTCKRCGQTGVERPILSTEIPVSSKSSGELPVVHLPPKPSPRDSDFGDFSRFGDFEIEEEISRTPAGVTYRARHREEGKRVLLCVLTSEALADEELAHAVKEELEKLTRFRHRGIVRVFDVKVHMRQRYYTKEILSGRSLREVIREGQLLLSEKVRIVKELAEAVEYAHSQSLLHGHLVPEIIYVDDDVHPKIAEMGRVRELVEAADEALPYRAPEQIRGEKLRPGTDVYCLGAILYELLTGTPPFSGGYDSVIDAINHREPAAPQQIIPDIDEALAGICLRALLKESGDRYPTAGSFAADLDRFLRGEPTSAASRKISRNIASSSGDLSSSAIQSRGEADALGPPRSLKPLLAIGGVVLILLGVLAFVFFGGPGDDPQSPALQAYQAELDKLETDLDGLLVMKVDGLTAQTAASFLRSAEQCRERFDELVEHDFEVPGEAEQAVQLRSPVEAKIAELFLLEARALIRPPSDPEGRAQAKRLLLKAKTLLSGERLARAHNALGLVYLLEGADEFAQGEFETVLGLDADNVEARYGLSRILSRQGRWDEALGLLAELATEPSLQDDGYFWLTLGECNLRERRVAEAVDACARADALMPGLGWSHFARLASGLGADADRLVLPELRNVSGGESHYAVAVYHLARGRARAGLIELELAEQAGLNRAKTVLTEAEAREQVLDLEASATLLGQLEPARLPPHLRGRMAVLQGLRLWVEGGEPSAVAAELERARELSPEDREALLARLDLMLLHEQEHPTLRNWLEGLNALSSSPDLQLRKALLDRELDREYLDTLSRAASAGQLDATALLLSELIDPGNPEVWRELEADFRAGRQRAVGSWASFYAAGLAELFRLSHGGGDGARLAYAARRARTLAPFLWPSRLLEARSAAAQAGLRPVFSERLGLVPAGNPDDQQAVASDPRFDQALREIEAVLALHPLSEQALRLKASIGLVQGKAREFIFDREGSRTSFDAAHDSLTRLSELRPDEAEIWLRLSEASLSLGRGEEEVRNHALRAFELDPFNRDAVNLLWQLAALGGNEADAERWQRELSRIEAEHTRVPTLLEDAARASAGGDDEAARALLIELLARAPDTARAHDLLASLGGPAAVEHAARAALLDPTYCQGALVRGRGARAPDEAWPQGAVATAVQAALRWGRVEAALLEERSPAPADLELGLALARQLCELVPGSPLGLLFELAFRAAGTWLEEAKGRALTLASARFPASQESGVQGFIATVYAASGHVDAAREAIARFEAAGGSIQVLYADPAFARMNQ